MTNLTDVCDFQGGTQPPKSSWSKTPQNGYVRMLQIRDFTQQKDTYIEFVKDSGKLKKCDVDDILIGRYGASIGKILTGLSGAYNVAIVKTIPNQGKISREFLYYLLKGGDFQIFIKNIGSRAAQAGFNKTELKKFTFHLPSLAEQKRIGKILNQANNLLQKRKQSILLLDEHLKSVFLEMFGDPVTNPKNWERYGGNKYSEKISVGVVVKPASYYVEHGIPALRSQNITKDGIVMNNLVYFSQKDNDAKLSKSIIQTNNVLIVRTGQPGTAAIVPKKLAGANCIDVIIVKLNQKIITPEYLVAFFNSVGGKNIVLKTARGQIQQHFNVGALNNAQIPIPPIKLQQQFSNIFKEHKALKLKMLNQSKELEMQFQALMQKSFSLN